MPALKSDNPTNAMINLNFVIRVSEYLGKKKVIDENGKETEINLYSKTQLTTARKCILHIKDEKIKIRLFNEVLEGTKQKYTFKIRNRLRIDFHSK